MIKLKTMNNNQNGNILFLILIAVVLFAALSYAVTQSSRGSSNADKETLKLVASEMLQDASLMSQAVQRLMLIKGCSDTEISVQYDWDGDGTLENNGDDNNNSSAPADRTCHIFFPEGAGMPWKTKPGGLLDSDILESYRLEGNTLINGFGDDTKSELIYTLIMDNTDKIQNLCDTINEMTGLPKDLYASVNYSWIPAFRGTYSDPNTGSRNIGNDVSETDFVGQSTGCFRTSHTGTKFSFFHVVHGR